MATQAVPEQIAQSAARRQAPQPGAGMPRAVAEMPVQMLLMMQRTAGNRAVNQLLRQYTSSRQAPPGLALPAVQRCGGNACNCSPREQAAHAAGQSLEEEPAPVPESEPARVQRDASDDDDGTGDGGAPDASGGSGAAPGDQGSPDPATNAAAPNTPDSPPIADQAESAGTQAGPTGGDQPAGTADQDDGGQPAASAATQPEATGSDQPADSAETGDPAADGGSVAPVAALEGEGEPHDEVVFGGDSLQLQGRTNAHFRSSFSAPTMTTTPGTDCTCAAASCVHVTGTMTSTFTMTTDVSLPPVPSGLSACQQKTVRAAISTCLAPHEQRHVAAFNAYRGTVQTPFDFTSCRADVQSTLQGMHNAIEGPRHDAVQASSDALDPFQVDIDLDCQPGDDPNAGVHCPPPS